jgi:hypothetical protein
MLNKKGATSILIIMLMVVLMVFGLTILTATLSNDALSNRKIQWLSDYYMLEGLVAEELAEIDYTLQELLATTATNEEYFDAVRLKYDTDDLLYDFTVSEEQGDYLKHIDVTLHFIEPKLTDNNKLILFDLIAYRQTQDFFEYDDIEFGVPFPPKTE